MSQQAHREYVLEFTQHIASILDARGLVINHEINEKKICDYFDAFTAAMDSTELIVNGVINRRLYYDGVLELYKNIMGELLDYEVDDIDSIARSFVDVEVEALPDRLNGE
jgi:hypothetical protein